VVDVRVGNQLSLQPHKLVKGEVEIAVPSIVHGERTVRRFTPKGGFTAALNRRLGVSQGRS
jgi:hypothetical protein